MWKMRGTTVGGIVCNLRVVRLDGRPMDWPTAIVRALGCFLSAAVAGLGFIWGVFDPERPSWHHKIAGTLAGRGPPGAAPVWGSPPLPDPAQPVLVPVRGLNGPTVKKTG